MPSPVNVNIAQAISDLVTANACQIGRRNLFNFRYRLTPTTVVPVLGFYVPYPNCTVVVELMRSAASDVNFQYGAVHEYIVYNYTNGVGSFTNTTSIYTFNVGAGVILTRTDSFIAGSGSTPPFLGIRFSQLGPVTTYLAGFGYYTFIPDTPIPPGLIPQRPTSQFYAVNSAFLTEALSVPYDLYPYRRYNTHIHVPLPSTAYRVSPDIGLDPSNSDNSVMYIKLTMQGSEILNHANNITAVRYYTLQGGGLTVPPYIMLLRNVTGPSNTPNTLNNSMGVTIGTVLVAGSASVPPAVYFTASATNVPTECEIFTKVEVVCSAFDPANYS